VGVRGDLVVGIGERPDRVGMGIRDLGDHERRRRRVVSFQRLAKESNALEADVRRIERARGGPVGRRVLEQFHVDGEDRPIARVLTTASMLTHRFARGVRFRAG
jgi:hypothetical protein